MQQQQGAVTVGSSNSWEQQQLWHYLRAATAGRSGLPVT